MRILKHILCAILAASLLAGGLPLFSPDDANRDTRVNLEDAILHVRDFAQTAEDPAAFKSGVEKALSTLFAVAGLKKSIKSADDSKSYNSAFLLSLVYIVSSYTGLTPPDYFYRVYADSCRYQSIDVTPDSPPPQFS